jgi:predicted acylesterase/phospholipase RssA
MKTVLYVALFAVVQVSAEPPIDTQQVRVGLTLSAGGAFGLAHIGVLKVLEREGIPVCCISSNSMGSIIGGLYAAGFSATQVESISVNMNWAELLSPSLAKTTQYLPQSRQSHRYIFRWSHDRFSPSLPSELISLQKVEFLLMRLLSKILYDVGYSFDDLEIPLRVIAVDLVSGRRVVMKQGRLDQAIRGSIAIPGVFAPQTATGQVLVDGGVLQYFPVDPLYEFNPDLIIASLTITQDTAAGISLVDVVARTTSIAGFEDIQRQKMLADIVIEPDLNEFSAQDYSRAAEIISVGEKAAAAMLPDIRKKVAGRTCVALRNTVDPRPAPHIRSIEFEGLAQTRQKTINDEIETSPGTRLDFDRLIDDLERMFGTGLFNHVDYHLVSVGGDTVDLVIEVEEKDFGFYLLGIRYDNRNNATIGLEIGQSNMFGRGICIRTAVNLGDPNEYRLGVCDTRTLGLPLGYQIDLFWSSIDRAYYEAGTWQAEYNTDCRGGIVEVGYNLGIKSYINLGMHAYQVLYRIPESPFFDTIPQQEWIIGPSFNLELNDYDDIYSPCRGGDYRLEVIYGLEQLGTKEHFLRIEFIGDQLLPLTSGILINSGIHIGGSIGKLPWGKYFYTGGENFAGLMSEEVTSDQKMVLRLGLDFKLFTIFGQNNPLFLQFMSNIASYESFEELQQRDAYPLEAFDLGIGAGIRTGTPLGPFCVTFGMANMHREPREDNIRYSVHFSLGRDFRYTK